ncbi:sugar transferase [Cryptosporangium sp. NPDC048952]|uniref:sugar transferase n=1 Tax=Cryptosporangium sp. NPDC048952 TaxID=3363961 RepID=UPI00371A5D4A
MNPSVGIGLGTARFADVGGSSNVGFAAGADIEVCSGPLSGGRRMIIQGASAADISEAVADLPAQAGDRSVGTADRTIELSQLRMEAEEGKRGGSAGWERQYVWRLLFIDLQVGFAAGLAAYLLRFGQVPGANWTYLTAAAALPFGWVMLLAANRAYEARYLFVGGDESRRVVNAAFGLTAGIAVLAYSANAEFARGYVILSMPLLLAMDLLARYLLRVSLNRQRRRGSCMHRAIVLGYEQQIVGFARQLERETYHGMRVVGACLPRTQANAVSPQFAVPVYGSFDDAVKAIRESAADTLIVLPCQDMDPSAVRALSWDLEGTGVDLVLANALMDVTGPRTSIRPVDGLPLLHVEPAALSGARRVVKRAFDIVLAGVLLAVLSPLLILVGAAVRLTSRGPATFVQTRVGKGGKEFRLYKFRSMYVDSEQRLSELQHKNEHSGVLFKIKDDPRITKIGKYLRRLSIDELPQLLNVIKGDMSLVGPRPPLPKEVAQYANDVRRRLAVIPGLTGLWQVSGRSNLSWEDSVRLDLRYVENWSLSFDLVILFRTIAAVVRSSGAY